MVHRAKYTWPLLTNSSCITELPTWFEQLESTFGISPFGFLALDGLWGLIGIRVVGSAGGGLRQSRHDCIAQLGNYVFCCASHVFLIKIKIKLHRVPTLHRTCLIASCTYTLAFDQQTSLIYMSISLWYRMRNAFWKVAAVNR